MLTKMKISLFCATILATGAPAVAQAAATVPAEVSGWVSRAVKTRPEDATRIVHLAVYLGLRNEAALRDLVAAQKDPSTAEYGHFLTPAAFHARFAPDPAAVKIVQRELQRLGFRIEHTPESGLFVEISGSVGLVKSAFRVSQDLYSYEGKLLRANAEAPTLTPALAAHVVHIGGLDDTALLIHPMHILTGNRRSTALVTQAMVHRNAPPPTAGENPSPFCDTYFNDLSAAVTPAPTPYLGTIPWLGCDYTPQQLRAAYGVDKTKLDGTGVRVAAVDIYASPTIVRDVNTYSKNHGLPKLTKNNFTQIVPKGIYSVPATDPCGPQGWYGEQTLDLESIHSMAPNASLVYVGDSCTNLAPTLALYNAIDTDAADIMSNSYGFNGEPLSVGEYNVQNAMYEQAAAEGITLLFSSGDDGDLSQDNGIASGSWPATSPYVTGVGGTSLLLQDASGAKSEYGWGTYRALFTKPLISPNGTLVKNKGIGEYSFYAGSGGGPSLFQAEPSYQKKLVPTALATGTYTDQGAFVPLNPAKRVTPDVAMDADPYTGFLYGETFTISTDPVANTGCTPINDTIEYCEGGIGGTSLASPLFAGVMALVEQARFDNGLPAIGFANPSLYKLKVGNPGSTTTPLVDILAPTSPTAVLRGYVADPTELRLVTINSVPSSNCAGGICQGIDDVFNYVAPGYDNTTGLGTTYVPSLISTLGAQ